MTGLGMLFVSGRETRESGRYIEIVHVYLDCMEEILYPVLYTMGAIQKKTSSEFQNSLESVPEIPPLFSLPYAVLIR